MEVRITDVAGRQLTEIFEYVSLDQPLNAVRLIERLLSRAESLGHLHSRGRKVPEYRKSAVREVFELGFRIIYRMQDEHVEVLAVVHSRRILPNDLFPDE